MVFQGASVNDGIVPDIYKISDNRLCLLIGAVNDGSILYVYLILDSNGINIASYHSIKPNTTFITHNHFTHHSGIISEETIFSKNRRYAFYRFYKSHREKLITERRYINDGMLERWNNGN